MIVVQAVNSPLHYSIIVTRQKSMAMIGLVWLVAAILSAPVWAGSVLLQHYAPRSQQEPEPSSDTYNGTASQPVLAGQLPTRDQQQEQQYLMNLCYSISLILFGFVWPLAALCWLYLRMYEAALKNSARTRRQSLCSNTNANATEGVVGAAAVAAAATAAATSHVDSSTGTSHHPSLVDALSSAAAAAAVAAENQTCVRLLAAAAAATNSQPRRSNRCVKSTRFCPAIKIVQPWNRMTLVDLLLFLGSRPASIELQSNFISIKRQGTDTQSINGHILLL